MLVLRQKLSDPVFLLAVVAALGAFVVQSGELGSSDTTHRLQVAHSFWTSEPPVFPQEYPEFGLHGRGGKLQSWYGMGQSLLLLPADIIGTYIERLPIFARYNGNDPAVRNIVVSYITNILVNVLTADRSALFAPARLQHQTISSRRSSVALLHYPPALHAEHDGKQLHHASDAGRIFISIRVAEHRQPPRSSDRLD